MCLAKRQKRDISGWGTNDVWDGSVLGVEGILC